MFLKSICNSGLTLDWKSWLSVESLAGWIIRSQLSIHPLIHSQWNRLFDSVFPTHFNWINSWRQSDSNRKGRESKQLLIRFILRRHLVARFLHHRGRSRSLLFFSKLIFLASVYGEEALERGTCESIIWLPSESQGDCLLKMCHWSLQNLMGWATLPHIWWRCDVSGSPFFTRRRSSLQTTGRRRRRRSRL